MKKLLSIIACMMICVVSLSFAGCSLMDDEDKALLNGAASTFDTMVENQEKNNASLLEKIEDLTEEISKLDKDTTNQDLLDKIDDISKEISQLKQEKTYTQEEISVIFQGLVYQAAINFCDRNYLMEVNAERTDYGEATMFGNQFSMLVGRYTDETTGTIDVMIKGDDGWNFHKESVKTSSGYTITTYDFATGETTTEEAEDPASDLEIPYSIHNMLGNLDLSQLGNDSGWNYSNIIYGIEFGDKGSVTIIQTFKAVCSDESSSSIMYGRAILTFDSEGKLVYAEADSVGDSVMKETFTINYDITSLEKEDFID